jgi:alpha-1,6-mannosyltransferase
MASNILEIWNADRRAVSEQARALALQFSWDRSMEALFGRVYPTAFARSATRRVTVVAPLPVPLVRA